MLLSNPTSENLALLQEKDLQELQVLAKASNTTEWTPPLTKLVERVITHYENHYRVESKLIMEDVRILLLLFPEWPSHQLGDSFLWIGGWRPSITLYLLLPQPAGPPSQLGELLERVRLKGSQDVSPSQLVRVGDLMTQTVQEETELSQFLFESDLVVPETELTQSPFESDSVIPSPSKIRRSLLLGDVFRKADDVRLRALKSLVCILSPLQAVQFFIPAAELHLKAQERAAHDRGPEAFSGFFERWHREQARDLEELWKDATELTRTGCKDMTESTRRLVSRVVCHYESYYKVKNELIKQNVLQMLNPAWMTPLEHAFLWIGEWRPTMSIHILYSVMGLQLDSRLSELLEGYTLATTGDLGDISGSQLARLDELQMKTVKQERELSETLAVLQDTVADSSMVKLSHIATELKRAQTTESVSERIELKLCVKEEKLKEVFWKADSLRLKTLKEVVNILSPIQALHFLIAAAELHLRFHEWGKNKDADSPADAAQQQHH